MATSIGPRLQSLVATLQADALGNDPATPPASLTPSVARPPAINV
jgi:hypothetical protein